MKRTLAILLSVLSLSLARLPQAQAAGKTTANFLKVDAGGRAAAMGGNQFAADNNSFAQFYNPAFLSGLSQKEVGFMHNQYFQDIRQEIFTFARPTERLGNFAFALNYFTYGQIAGFTATGAPTGDISANDILLQASWGRKWNYTYGNMGIENLGGGVTFKALRKKLQDDTATGVAMDIGFSYPLRWKYLRGGRLGAAFQNLGPGLKFKSESSPLPQTIRLGGAYSFWGEAVNLSLDGVMVSGGGSHFTVGAEYKLMKMIAIRAGNKSDSSLDKNFTYGVGFENPLFGVDYAFVPFGELGDTHRVSAHFRFGKSYQQPKADALLQEKVKEAKTLYAQGQLVDAYMAAVQIQHVAPWMEENNRLLSTVQKDFRELEESDKKEKLQQQVAILFSRAEKFFEEGNLINARLEFQAVLGLQPDNKAAQGYIRQIEGQFRSFVESFYRAGMIAFAEENYKKAKEEFEKVLVIKHDHDEAKAQLAKCNEILEKKQQEIERAAQKDTIARTYKEGLDSYKKENFEESLALFEEILKIEPTHDEAARYAALAREVVFKQYINSGKDLISKGEWEAAIKNIRKAVSFSPQSKEAKNLLEDALRRWDLQRKVISQNLYKEGLEAFLSGDKNKARTIWQKAVDLDPENEEAKRGLARTGQ